MERLDPLRPVVGVDTDEVAAPDALRPEVVGEPIGAAVERFGGLNVVVANAGIIRDSLLINTDRETGNAIIGNPEEVRDE